MKAASAILVVLLCLAGCSSESPKNAGTTDSTKTTTPAATPTTAAQPSNANPAATGDDVQLMAEYLVFTHLADSLIYKPVNDTAAMAALMNQIDMTKPDVNTSMMHLTLTYLHGIFTKAMPPLQQFAGNARTPAVKEMADEFTTSLQQITNQYYRAMKMLEQGGSDSARAEQMQQVGQLLQGGGMSISRLRFDQGSRAAFAAAYRVMGR